MYPQYNTMKSNANNDKVYGLGVDNIREVELVLPDGQVINASRCQNEDLFFAIRGGGGGTWGVIISLKYKVIPKHKIVVSIASFSAIAQTNFDPEVQRRPDQPLR